MKTSRCKQWVRRVARWGGLACVAAAMVACGGADEAPVAAPQAPVIGSSGGTVSEASGARVIVPAGALGADTTIRVAMDSTGAPVLPQGLLASGNTYVITPHGGEFAEPVEVRIPASNAGLLPNEELKLAKAQPGGEWELLTDSVLADGMLSARVSSFSYFVPVRVSYLLPIAELEPMRVTSSLSCGDKICEPALGTIAATYVVTTNAGQLPVGCSTSQLIIQAGGFSPDYATGSSGTNVPLSGGSVTRTLPPRSPYYFTVGARCSGTNYHLNYGAAAGRRVLWTREPHYPDLAVMRAPAQLDLVPGLSANLDVILAGGAAGLQNDFVTHAVPTAANRAVIDWQRSDDNGASWLAIARSYQNEANPNPVGPDLTWKYWSVRHGFIAASADQGALLRVYACYTPPDVAAPACVAGPPTRLNVLQQSALPAIVDAPRSVLVRTGETASLSATVSGAPAPALQWQTRAANATGAWTNVSLGAGGSTVNYTTAALSTADNGTQYRVLATNALGSAESAPVTVSVSDLDVAPTVTTQPAALNVTVGNDAAFAIAAHGTEALSYQWQLNGAPITGANSAVLRLPAVTVGQAGSYRVVVSNSAGTVTSEAAVLSVSAGTAVAVAPSIVTQPVAVTVNAGNTATLAVGASGSGPLAFQWLRNGQPVVGATAAFHSIASVVLGDAADYTVRVSNSAGSVTSAAATLAVNANPQASAVTLTTQPSPQVQAPGGSATLAVAASGSGPLSYQWLKNGAPVVGASTAVLTLANLVAEDGASYSVTVSNALGSVTSQAAVLTVLGVPAISSQPAGATVVAGGTASFSVTASGAGLRYQWLRNGVAVAGAVAASYTTPVLAVGDSGALYGVLVYNGAGVVFSQSAVLSVTAAPVATGPLAIVANSSSNTLSIYRANASTGVLAPIGTTGAGAYPYAVVVTPNGQFAYVSNLVGNNLSSYRIDSAAGTVTTTGSSVNSVNPYGVAMDPLGRFVWAANYSAHTVSAYSINSTTGQLTSAGAPVATGANPYAVAAHPSGDYLYVANEGANSIGAYRVNADGTLTLLGGTIASSVNRPHSLVVDPSGRFVYVTENGGFSVATFRVNASTGVLSLVGYVNAGSTPAAVTVHPNGQFVYVSTSAGVSQFVVNTTTGALTAIASPIAAGSSPAALVIDPTGTQLQVTNLGGNSASGFSIDATTGALTSLGAAVSTGTLPSGIAMAP